MIKTEWDQEISNLKESGNFINIKKNMKQQRLDSSGHAEVEGGKTLYIYGQGLEVLARKEF